MRRFRDTREFQPTIDAAAETLSVSATAVEKDYWVSQILGVLSGDFGDDFIFKGGTSLSKGYRIIERFSEDVDVLVLPGDRGRGATDKLMKEFGAAAALGVGGKASSFGGAETGRHRCYEVSYPTRRGPTELVSTSVRLEMGVRGGPEPHEEVLINSLLGDVLRASGTDLGEFDDLEPFAVLALHPARTLLEKLTHVHSAARILEGDNATMPDRRIGRHFYDVFRLLNDDRVLTLLADGDQTAVVISSIEEVTRTHFTDATQPELRPEGGFAMSPAFDLDSDTSQRMRASYETTMPELYFGLDPLPTWEEICTRVLGTSELL